jgi:putative PIN family toxin of toxin-antitoxin system
LVAKIKEAPVVGLTPTFTVMTDGHIANKVGITYTTKVKPIQIILDTNIVYSALRSRNGASFLLMSLLPSKTFELNLSVPLVLEYEDVLKRPDSSLLFTPHEIDTFLDQLCSMANCHSVFYLWRPLLRDPGDDLILELAVRSNCEYIVTSNKADFDGIETFNIKVVDAKEFLTLIGELP